jgi:hypothetical protein
MTGSSSCGGDIGLGEVERFTVLRGRVGESFGMGIVLIPLGCTGSGVLPRGGVDIELFPFTWERTVFTSCDKLSALAVIAVGFPGRFISSGGVPNRLSTIEPAAEDRCDIRRPEAFLVTGDSRRP